MKVERGDPRHPEATALLQQSHALMRELFPPEENYFLDIEELCTPDVLFFVAVDEGKILGTAAMALKDGYGEVKSMFVDPTARGKGIADALMTALDRAAAANDLPRLRLETAEILTAAVKLYSRHGFAPCPLFGDYVPNTSSLFMEKRL